MSTVGNAKNNRLHPIQVPFDVANKTVSKVSGLDGIAKLGISIIGLYSFFTPQGNVFTPLGGRFQAFKDVTDSTKLIARFNEWFVPKAETGKPACEDWKSAKKGWKTAKVASRVSLTFGHTLSLVGFLKSVELIDWAKVFAVKVGNLPVFKLVKDVAIILSAVFSIIHVIPKLFSLYKGEVVKGSVDHATKKVRIWNAKDLNDAAKTQKITDYQEKLARANVDPKKRVEWQDRLDLLRSDRSVDTDLYKQHKVKRWEKKHEARKIEKTKSWISIAADVAKIAVIGLASVLLGMGYVTGLPVLLIGLSTNLILYSKYLYEQYHPAIEIPTLNDAALAA